MPLELGELDPAVIAELTEISSRYSNWRNRRPMLLFFHGCALLGSSDTPVFSPETTARHPFMTRVLETPELVKQLIKAH